MRLARRLLAVGFAFVFPILGAAQQVIRSAGHTDDAQPAPAPHRSTLVGIVIDSLHGGTVSGATVLLDGTTASAETDQEGKFRIDSIPPGDYRIAVFHPLLDTLGIAIGTKALRFGPDSIRQVVLSTPSGPAFVATVCPADKRKLGPAAVIGKVFDPDTNLPLDSTHVSIVWGKITADKENGVHRTEFLREATTDASGAYVICGIPSGVHGTIQADHDGMKTAEVPIDLGNAPLAIEGLSLPRTVTASNVPLTGEAVFSGRILDDSGKAVPDAQIVVQGSTITGNTSKDGRFHLSGLPSGTRGVLIRHIGYSPVQLAVDLSAKTPVDVSLKMTKSTPQLAAVRIQDKYNAVLKQNGFTDRKRQGMGHYMTAEDIEKRIPFVFSDLFQMMPGFRVEPGTIGNKIVANRSRSDTCVTFWVDGIQYTENQPGEIDTYVRPEQILALETYSAISAPMQFRGFGGGSQSSCAVVVVWTNRTVR